MPLTKIHIASYGVGHVLNDMSGAVWFSYVLLYLQDAEGLSGTQAGWVMFSGQVADALATILVGLASDAGQGCCFLGRRKAWNLAGVVIVAINFGIMFGQVFPGWATMGSVGKAVVLGVAGSLFNMGWAAVQVSHMSLVPELTSDMRERVTLNSVRYGFTVLSNCAVFLVMLALLPDDASAQVDDPRYRQPSLYQDLATVVLCVGLAFSAFFLLFCKEPSAEELRVREEAEAEEEAHQQQQQRQQQTADLEQEELGSGDEEGLEEPLLPPSSALWYSIYLLY
jgi:Na+/melibiose symporter-like transporter